MVRASFLNEIGTVISASNFFDVNDFDISTKEENRNYSLQIQYKYDRRFWFTAQIPKAKSSDAKISVTTSPGEINEKETNSVDSKYGLSRSVGEWLVRMREELLAIPVYRQVNEQRRNLEETLKRLQDVEEVAFSREEADEIKAELDKLKEQMIEHIKSNAEGRAEQNQKIQAITNDVDALKSSVDVLSKPNWARAAITRFYKWAKDPDNRGLIKDGVEVTSKLLSGQVDGQ